MQKPFFSIIMVSLNPGEELKKTLDSVLDQSIQDYEVIIKDGGSMDGSLSFIKKEEERFLRVRVYEQRDKSIYDAMNQALAYAQGRYLLFLNCGDYLYDSYVLEKVKKEILTYEEKEKQGIPLIFYGNLYNRRQKTFISSSPEMTDFTLYRNVPCHQVCFYEKSLFHQRAYDLTYRVRADYEHFLYCIKEKQAKAVAISLPVASYEGGGFSETEDNKRISAGEHQEITLKYLGRAKFRKYRLLLLVTLAPVRTMIAENPKLSTAYNGLKSMIYQLIKG